MRRTPKQDAGILPARGPDHFARRWRLRAALLATAASVSCTAPSEPPAPAGPQTVVLLATPKMIADFADPEADVARFLQHYEPLIGRASQTIVIFAVGNSDHILTYRGPGYWPERVDWARFTDFKPVSDRILDYREVEGIVRAFKSQAATMGASLKVFDQVDSGNEFANNPFKEYLHRECMDSSWHSYDIRGRLKKDAAIYASAPHGIAEGKLCGEFLVDQVDQYLRDLGFDGILYGNQLGTRGRWTAENGPGYSTEEATAILDFLEYSKRVLWDKDVMWFDSYNNVDVERRTFSFPAEGYHLFDYLIAAGFCVITDTDKYVDDLRSKLRLIDRPRVLATLDYVDPWYTYNSMTAYPAESARLEQVAITYRSQIDGIVLFANDEVGALVPRALIESFATRFFGPR